MSHPGPTLADGRHLFGQQLDAYLCHRPGYPQALWQRLDDYHPGAGPAFEIGAGSGLATAQLLTRARPLHAIEPDPQMAGHLQQRFAHALEDGQLQLVQQPFEQLDDPVQPYAAGYAATSFHWLPAAGALARVRRWLRPGGVWAMWWNVFGDPRQPDAWARASADLFAPLASHPSRIGGLPYALDADARMAELQAAGFIDLQHHCLHWQMQQDTAAMLGLTATFSPVACLPEAARHDLLQRLAARAQQHFGGRLQRHFLTPLYLATAP